MENGEDGWIAAGVGVVLLGLPEPVLKPLAVACIIGGLGEVILGAGTILHSKIERKLGKIEQRGYGKGYESALREIASNNSPNQPAHK